MRDFFGLNDDYIEYIYDQFFALKYYGGWSFFEAYSLPIGLRNWFLEKLKNHIERENEAIKEQ